MNGASTDVQQERTRWIFQWILLFNCATLFTMLLQCASFSEKGLNVQMRKRRDNQQMNGPCPFSLSRPFMLFMSMRHFSGEWTSASITFTIKNSSEIFRFEILFVHERRKNFARDIIPSPSRFLKTLRSELSWIVNESITWKWMTKNVPFLPRWNKTHVCGLVCVHMWKFPYHRRCFEGIKKMITSEMGAMA